MTSQFIVAEQPPPSQSRLSGIYQDADLVDTFGATLTNGVNYDLFSLGTAIFGQPIPVLALLSSVREVVARWFTQEAGDEPLPESTSNFVGIFPVLSSYQDELILGKNNRLMSLQISPLIAKGVDDVDRVLATTVVLCHTRRAKAYVAIIKPFHRFLMRLSLYRASKAGFAIRILS